MKDARDQKIPYKIYLSESEMPKTWYNVRADMKKQTGAASESGDVKAHDGGGAVRSIL